MTDRYELRPLERRILEMSQAGVDEAEIAMRFRRSPGFIRRVIDHSAIPRPDGLDRRDDVLRPRERRILRWREQGASYADIASRFRRTPAYIRRVEGFAQYKLDLA